LLDAGAIAVTDLYALGAQTKSNGQPFALKEQDFAKGFFWQVLQKEMPSVYARYLPLKETIDAVIPWREAAIHRVSPLVITTMARDPNTQVAQFYRYSLVLDPEARIDALLSIEESSGTVPVLHFYDLWMPDLSKFCDEVCADIKANS
jgi:hypothetical protein